MQVRRLQGIWIHGLLLAAVISTVAAYKPPAQTIQDSDSNDAQPSSYKAVQQIPGVCVITTGCIDCSLGFRTSESTPAATIIAESPVVRAVIFWINGCSSCHHVLENVLPPLQEKYGDQFQVRLIEVVGLDDYEQLVSVAASLGVPKEQVFVPFLILDEHALIGSDQIQSELPGLIEKYLAQGRMDWPAGLPVQATATAMVDYSLATTVKPVKFIVFTTLECHSCRGELATALRPVVEEYGDQIEYRTIDIRTSEDVEYLYQVAAEYGYKREHVDLPLVIIGRHLLMVERIAAELPDLVEGYLFSGGIDYPEVPVLPGQPTATVIKTATALPATPPPSATAIVSSLESENPDGFVLAMVVMAFMAAALVYAMARLVWTENKNAGPITAAAWQNWLIPALSLLGLGVAGYLAYVETQLVHAVCGPVGDCNAVQSSPYARLFGVLPVGLLGIAGYLAILAAWLWGRLKGDRNSGYAALAVTGMSLFGTLFSLYLTYLEPFVIQAVCLWCLASAILITLLLLFSLKPALNAICLKK